MPDAAPDRPDRSSLMTSMEAIARSEGRPVDEIVEVAMRFMAALSPAMRGIVLAMHDACGEAEWRRIVDAMAKETMLAWDDLLAEGAIPTLEASTGASMRTPEGIALAVRRMLDRDDTGGDGGG